MPIHRVNPRYFAIALCPIVIFWINSMITGHLIEDSLHVPSDILQDGRPWLETAGRYRFLAATWLFASFIVLAVALLCRNLARPLARDTRVAAVATVLIILLMAVIPTIENIVEQDGPRVYRHIGADVFEAALARGGLPGCNGPQDYWLLGQCGDIPVISLFGRVLDFVNVLAGLGVGALIVGMILCLETRAGASVEQEAVILAENLRQMRHQLYLSSLILTFGMFFATSWMYWPFELVLEAEQPAYKSLVLAAALFTGTYFTLLILSFYIPVALILDDRVKRVAAKAREGQSATELSSVDDWRSAHDLKDSTGDYLRAGLALIAPILAAFAGGISPVGL